MDKSFVFETYSAILDKLLDTSDFMRMYCQRPYMLDESYEDMNVTMVSGATRCCMIAPHNGYVVKFDIEEDGYGSACSREERIYEAAKELSLEQYLTEVAYIGTYTRTIYWYDVDDIEDIMEWECVADFEDRFPDAVRKLKKRPIHISLPLYGYRFARSYHIKDDVKMSEHKEVDRCGSPLRSRSNYVAIAFLREYGFEEYKRFSQFGLEWDMNDIHMGNIGRVDGKLVLIDFAGYHCDSDMGVDDGAWWTRGTDDEEDNNEEF